ncbi:MAG: hypothetical protein KAX65_09050, partial [Caldilineaceae bacterium]|nr:hypothetical protein [Caldilineaceae bacterium]
GGLTEGAYRMGFSDPASVYATQYYSQAVHPGRSETINLAPAEQRRDIDAALEPGGAIAGRITLDDSAPAVGYIVHFFHVITSPWISLLEMPLRATTDETGAYRMAGLAPGVYRVCASAAATEWSTPRGCFGGPPLNYQPFRAESVLVRAGEETANIDIDLGQPDPPAAYLPLVTRQLSATPPFTAIVLVYSYVHLCPAEWCTTSGEVQAGTVVNVIGCDGDCTWYQLDDGGWVLAASLAPQPPAGRTTP